jgi:hypothetical protein
VEEATFLFMDANAVLPETTVILQLPDAQQDALFLVTQIEKK